MGRNRNSSLPSTEGVEDEEPLKASALVRQLTSPVQNQIDDLLADGVMSAGVVVGSVLLPCDQLLGVEQLAVGPRAHLINDGGLQVHKDGPGNVLPRPSLAEEGVEGVISPANRLVRGHLSVWLDSMLQAIKFPTCIAHLGSGLADMHRNTLAHFVCLSFDRRG